LRKPAERGELVAIEARICLLGDLVLDAVLGVGAFSGRLGVLVSGGESNRARRSADRRLIVVVKPAQTRAR